MDRNKIKRQLRIALKKAEGNIPFGGACMLIYTGRKHPLTNELVEGVMNYLVNQILQNRNKRPLFSLLKASQYGVSRLLDTLLLLL